MKPVRKTDLLWREVKNEIVVLDQNGGMVHQLNQTAAFIWRHCGGCQSATEIAARLAREYQIPSAESEQDVNRALTQLIELGLLESR